MTTQLWFTLAGLGLCFAAGTAPGQSLTPAALANTTATQSTAAGQILVFRTAGQPDRRLQVENVRPLPDGGTLADIKDMDTGELFSVPGSVLAKMNEPPKQKPQPQVQPEPQHAAKPLSGELPPVAAAPVANAPSAVPVQSHQQQVLTPLTAAPTPVTKRATPQYVAESFTNDAGQKVIRYVKQPDTVLPQVQSEPSTPVSTQPNQTTPATQTAAIPTAPKTPIATEQARLTQVQWRSSQAPERIRHGQVWHRAKPIEPEPQPVTAPPEPSSYGTVIRGQIPDAPAPQLPQVYLERAQYSRYAPSARVRQKSIEQLVEEETKDLVYTLTTGLRPSEREAAATGLAECRYASRPEIKRTLARAALADPAVSVRSHCIGLLSKLGYHEPDYVVYLRWCAKSEHPMLQTSAFLALSKLEPKK
jgi:hypothetical protein